MIRRLGSKEQFLLQVVTALAVGAWVFWAGATVWFTSTLPYTNTAVVVGRIGFLVFLAACSVLAAIGGVKAIKWLIS